MADSRFLRVFSAFERRRGRVLAGLALAVLLSGLALTRVTFDNTLDLMLPADSPAQRMMAFLRDSNFSNKIVISLEARGPGETRASLMAAADALAASLGPPLVPRVLKGFTAPDLAQDAGAFLAYAPQLLNSNDLAEVERGLTPAGIDALLRQHYLQLLRPEGLFLAKTLQSDPLNLNRLLMARLQSLASTLDYDVAIEDGHFLSRDGRHALLIAETSVPMTDAAGSRRLLDYVGSALKALPPGIRASMICGHLHVVSNDAVIKRDLGVILSVASAGFMLLYLLFFRDPRGLLVFLMPALATVIAMAVTALWFPKLSYFVLAFGPVIAGIADDYGIVAYVAVRHGRRAGEAVRHVAKPVFVGAITTMAIFFAFFFSRIPGYRQLACFCILSVFIAVGLALFVLPLCLRPGTQAEAPPGAELTPAVRRRNHRVWVALFAGFLAVAGVSATRIRFDSDVTRLDGTAPEILRAEEAFQKVWGVRDRRDAMLVVVGPDYEATLEKNDAVYAQAAALAGTNRFVTLASVWPSGRTRAANERYWDAFWRDGRAETLRRLLAERGALQGFATNAFDPFFDGLAASNGAPVEPAANRVLSSLKDRFIQTPNGRVQALSYFPDEPALVRAFSEAMRDREDVFIVSRSVLGGILSDAFSGEVVRTSLLAGGLIVLTAFLFLRRVSLTLMALAPALAGVTGLLGGMAALNRPLNVANLISGVVVFGLCIDFGVHVLHACLHRESRTARLAVTFAAATTLMGAGVLLFARHPALHSIGFTLFVGVGAGYVTAMWVVPALCALWTQSGESPSPSRRDGATPTAVRACWLALCLLPLACASCRTAAPVTGAAEQRAAVRFDVSLPERFTARQTLVFEFRPHWWWPPVRLTALGYATVDRAARQYAVVCLSPLGMKLFEVSRAGDRDTAVFSVPLPGNREAIGQAMGNDIAALYFDLLPEPEAVMLRRGGTARFRQERDGRRVDHEFSVSTGRLMRKTIRDRGGRTTITFGDPGDEGAGRYPATVRLRNHRYGYTVTVRTRQLEAGTGRSEE